MQNDAAVAWKTGLWYWNTQSGPGTMTAHNAMERRRLRRDHPQHQRQLECNGGNPAQMEHRVELYKESTVSGTHRAAPA